jgi:hypothetical protein
LTQPAEKEPLLKKLSDKLVGLAQVDLHAVVIISIKSIKEHLSQKKS